MTETFRKLDQQVKVREFFESLGCSDRQADVAVRSFGNDEKTFKWTGAALMWVQPDGTTSKAAFDPRCREFLEREYEFLLPPKKTVEEEFAGVNVSIDPAVLDAALGGSITALGTIAKAFGANGTYNAASKAAADKAELFIRAERAKRGGDGGNKEQHSTNPWSRAAWNITEQGRIAKSDLALANRLAAAAGSRLGATRPSQ